MKFILTCLLLSGSFAFADDLKERFDGVYANASMTYQALYSTHGEKVAQCTLLGILKGQVNASLVYSARKSKLSAELQSDIEFIAESAQDAIGYCGMGQLSRNPAKSFEEAAQLVKQIADLAERRRH